MSLEWAASFAGAADVGDDHQVVAVGLGLGAVGVDFGAGDRGSDGDFDVGDEVVSASTCVDEPGDALAGEGVQGALHDTSPVDRATGLFGLFGLEGVVDGAPVHRFQNPRHMVVGCADGGQSVVDQAP